MNKVNGKQHVWQSIVSITSPRDASRAERIREARRLPDGRYLAKVYVDVERRTEQDPEYDLGEREFVDEVELHGAWKPGYQPPKIAAFPKHDRAE